MSTASVIDIVVIVLVVGYAAFGAIKGFAKTFVSTFGTILSVLFALLLCKTCAEFLEKTFSLTTTLSENLSGAVEKIFGEELLSVPFALVDETTIRSSGLTGLLLNAVLSLKSGGEIPLGASLGEVVSMIFGYYLTVIIAVAVLFILFKLVFFIIGDLIVKARKAKIINFTDRFLGFVLGAIKGVVAVNFLVLIISALPIGFCQTIIQEMSNASFANFINKINVFELVLNNIIDSTSLFRFFS